MARGGDARGAAREVIDGAPGFENGPNPCGPRTSLHDDLTPTLGVAMPGASLPRQKRGLAIAKEASSKGRRHGRGSFRNAGFEKSANG